MLPLGPSRHVLPHHGTINNISIWCDTGWPFLAEGSVRTEIHAWQLVAWTMGSGFMNLWWMILKYFPFHPSSHATPACWLLCIFPGISIVEQLNDFHLFIIFGLSHYSIISIYLDGHPNYISIVVVRANGRQMEFPVITAICGRGVRDQHLSFVVLACLLGAATNLYDAKIRQTKSRIPRRP